MVNKRKAISFNAMNDLEAEIKKAVSTSETGTLDSEQTEVFLDKFEELVNQLKDETKYFFDQKEKQSKKRKKFISTYQKMNKKILFWSLPILVIVFADIQISSTNQQNVGTLFGLNISGFDKHEVILCLWLYISSLMLFRV